MKEKFNCKDGITKTGRFPWKTTKKFVVATTRPMSNRSTSNKYHRRDI